MELVEKLVKMPKFECDIFSDFQTLCTLWTNIFLPEIHDEHVIWITDVRGTKSTMKLVVKLI